MNKVESCCIPGNIAIIEQFTLAVEELRQYVVYTYYDDAEQPLYVGCSKDFYNAHFNNLDRLIFANDIKYVGFFFLDNEADMKDAKKHLVKARQPKYNQRVYKDTPLLPGLDPSCDDLVVYEGQMRKRWAEWLGQEENAKCESCPYEEYFKEGLVLTDELLAKIERFTQREGKVISSKFNRFAAAVQKANFQPKDPDSYYEARDLITHLAETFGISWMKLDTDCVRWQYEKFFKLDHEDCIGYGIGFSIDYYHYPPEKHWSVLSSFVVDKFGSMTAEKAQEMIKKDIIAAIQNGTY